MVMPHAPEAFRSVAPAHASGPVVAVLAPCLNEAGAIGDVVTDFKRALPDATLPSTTRIDGRHADVAMAAGAVVRRQRLRGKGNVVRQMFADIEADVHVLVDGDNTTTLPGAAADRELVQ